MSAGNSNNYYNTEAGFGGALIVVKIKHGSQPNDISIPISPSDQLKTLKDRVKIELHCPEKYVRLICGGKLLEPDTASIGKLGIQDGAFIHAVITSQSSSQGSQPATSAAATPSTPASASASRSSSNSGQHRGFDRLTAIGLTLDETAALRSSFQTQLDEFAAGLPPREGEDEHSYRFRLEELWMRNQGPTSEFTLNLPRASSTSPPTHGFSFPAISSIRNLADVSLDDDDHSSNSGSMREFIWGLLLGSTLGFLMLFCVWDRNISQSQKLGIMIGITVHMFTGYLQNSGAQYHSSSSSSSSSSSATSSLLRKHHQPLPHPQLPDVVSGGSETGGEDFEMMNGGGNGSVDIALELPVGR